MLRDGPPVGCVRRVARSKSIEAGEARKRRSFIALAALVLLTMAPAMVHPVTRHVVFFKALRVGDIVGAVGDEDARHRHDGGPVRGSPQDWRRGLKPPLSLTAAPSLERAECR